MDNPSTVESMEHAGCRPSCILFFFLTNNDYISLCKVQYTSERSCGRRPKNSGVRSLQFALLSRCITLSAVTRPVKLCLCFVLYVHNTSPPRCYSNASCTIVKHPELSTVRTCSCHVLFISVDFMLTGFDKQNMFQPNPILKTSCVFL